MLFAKALLCRSTKMARGNRRHPFCLAAKGRVPWGGGEFFSPLRLQLSLRQAVAMLAQEKRHLGPPSGVTLDPA